MKKIGFAWALACLCASSAIAEDRTEDVEPPPFPDFTFRFVRPPAPDHEGPRVNIWIEPQEEVATAEPEPDGDTPEAEAGGAAAGWFWAEIADDLSGGAARFQAALAHLSLAPETASLGVARLDHLRRLSSEYGADILTATVGTDISPALVLAVMSVESAGSSEAVSHAGAQGLMQLIPATAERFGVEDAFDGPQNIAGGVAYLSWLMGEFDRDPLLVLAAYNAGEGAVREAGGIPNFSETRAYVPKVLATWQLARQLCLSPPELISDGCVFEALVTSG